MFCLTRNASQSFFVDRIQYKEKNIFTEKVLFKEKEEWKIEQIWKEGFLIAHATPIKKDSTMSIRKDDNELKVPEKTVKTLIKQEFSPDINTPGLL